MAYLGKTPSQAVRSRYYFTATGGETSLSGTDDNSNTLTFTDGNYVDVALNGVTLVAGTDYNTTTANTIGALTALVASDVVEVIVYDTFSVFGGNVKGDFDISNGNLIVDTDTLYVDSTNDRVGIGTNSPDSGYKLDVHGNVVFGDGGGFDMNVNGTRWQFSVGGTERMRLDNNGRLGIGTTSPSSKLNVNGQVKFSNGNLGAALNDTIHHADIHGSRHHLDLKEVRTAADSDWSNTTYKMLMRVDNTDHQSIDFVSDGSYNEHIDIRTGNQLFHTRFTHDGRVGIGTTSPSYPLHVRDTVPELGLDDSNNGTGGTGYRPNVKFLADGTEVGSVGMRYNSNLSIVAQDYNSAAISFLTGGANERMRVTSGGNVGIGNTAPYDVRVHISGDSIDEDPTLGSPTGALVISNTDSAYGMQMGVSSGGEGWIQQGRVDGTATAYSLNLQPVGGNVGIGTDNPDSILTVKGANPKLHVRNSSDSNRGGYLEDDGTNFIVGTNSGVRALSFETDGTERMRLNVNGTLAVAPIDTPLKIQQFNPSGPGTQYSSVSSSYSNTFSFTYTPASSNSTIIMIASINFWADVDNDSQGNTSGQLRCQTTQDSTTTTRFEGEANKLNQGGQSRYQTPHIQAGFNNSSTSAITFQWSHRRSAGTRGVVTGGAVGNNITIIEVQR